MNSRKGKVRLNQERKDRRGSGRESVREQIKEKYLRYSSSSLKVQLFRRTEEKELL